MSYLPEALIFSNLRCYTSIKVSSINDNINLSLSIILLLNLPDGEKAYFLSQFSPLNTYLYAHNILQLNRL